MSLLSLFEGMGVKWTWKITWPSAAGDKCLFPECGVKREEHLGKDHKFVEKEK